MIHPLSWIFNFSTFWYIRPVTNQWIDGQTEVTTERLTHKPFPRVSYYHWGEVASGSIRRTESSIYQSTMRVAWLGMATLCQNKHEHSYLIADSLYRPIAVDGRGRFLFTEPMGLPSQSGCPRALSHGLVTNPVTMRVHCTRPSCDVPDIRIYQSVDRPFSSSGVQVRIWGERGGGEEVQTYYQI